MPGPRSEAEREPQVCPTSPGRVDGRRDLSHTMCYWSRPAAGLDESHGWSCIPAGFCRLVSRLQGGASVPCSRCCHSACRREEERWARSASFQASAGWSWACKSHDLRFSIEAFAPRLVHCVGYAMGSDTVMLDGCKVENCSFAQSVIRARMEEGHLCKAEIYDDIVGFEPSQWLKDNVQVLVGGYPCQDTCFRLAFSLFQPRAFARPVAWAA